ncbi:hypothetical protein HS088_TW13G01174 [Tripterygium wilfordii]|uniref:Uncharacterized protein n=1 Tax=Tripterygium wilfordii TaxID=458696 RepID=A0A7J7CW93_TRIWF|nr:hypothetical protein HS088_TW13G01174 [Tripterygium wilfordii]
MYAVCYSRSCKLVIPAGCEITSSKFLNVLFTLDVGFVFFHQDSEVLWLGVEPFFWTFFVHKAVMTPPPPSVFWLVEALISVECGPFGGQSVIFESLGSCCCVLPVLCDYNVVNQCPW